MDAEITPNRSLSRKGFIVLISVITAINFVSAMVFLSLGATLVPVFLGLDVLAIAAAFAASYAAARRVERVRVSPARVQVIRETPKAALQVWESPTAFTRLALVKEDERAVELNLVMSGRRITVAAALSPGEREAFARALEGAIQRARAARF